MKIIARQVTSWHHLMVINQIHHLSLSLSLSVCVSLSLSSRLFSSLDLALSRCLGMANVCALLVLVLLIYSILGVQLFAKVQFGDSINYHAHFQVTKWKNAGDAISMLNAIAKKP